MSLVLHSQAGFMCFVIFQLQLKAFIGDNKNKLRLNPRAICEHFIGLLAFEKKIK